MVKVYPKCLNKKEIAYTATGYLLPCCWLDKPTAWQEPQVKRLMKKHLKLENFDSVEEVVHTKEWKDFFEELKTNPAITCINYCSTPLDQPINKARESLSSDNVNLKSKGLPTYSVTNVFGSVPLNKEGSELTAYPDVFLYSTFNDGSIGLNNTELPTEHRQTISRRGKTFSTDDGIKTITLQITNTTTLIGAVTDSTFETQFAELFFVKTRSDLGTPTAISSFKTLSFATSNKPLINSSESP